MADTDALAGADGFVPALSSAARKLITAQIGDETATLSLIVTAAVKTVPGAEQAGVSLLHKDSTITSAATSHATVDEVDRWQAEYREGPCVTTLWDQHTVTIADLSGEAHRWPRFAPQAAALGVGSMLSFQLFARDGSLGALNLYAARPRSFDSNAHLLGELFAEHAATALGEARHVARLQQALATRDVIGQAKGVLMERFGVGADEAFRLLVSSSQEANMKLVAVAQWLTRQDARSDSQSQ
ncbi:GAF and ANTAR domain-containing protein [Salinifilum ghardaiensis]